MFYRDEKRKTQAQAKPLKDLTRMVSIEIILSDEKRTALLKQIRGECLLDESRFDSLCLTLIHQLIQNYQSLPENLNSYYSQPFGLIDHSLNRTEAALNLFRQYLILDASGEASEEQRLWQYALTSASLVQGIGKLYVDFVIDLYDDNGQILKIWNPLIENLASSGGYYVYHFQKETDKEFRRRINLLMARLVMPATGFAWIASEKEVLETWLALINEDFYAAGTLGAILERADAIALQKYFSQHLHRLNAHPTAKYGGAGTFAGGNTDLHDLEQKTGIEFIEWLRNSLANGKLTINKNSLMLVPDGLLITEATFKEFVHNHPEYKNWQAVKNGFLSLGLHRIGADGSLISRYEQTNNQQMYAGLVLANYSICLPPEVQLHNLITGKTMPISATELFYQAQFDTVFTRQQRALTENPALESVNKAGHWQKVPVIYASDATPSPTPGAGKRG